jgi:prepilin peptidase CpaA
MLALALVLAATAIAAISDLRTRRIPNLLVAALVCGGLVVNGVAGLQHLVGDATVTAAVIAAGTFLFSLRLIGGGDVKLLAAAAGTLAYPAGLTLVLYTLLCGGAIAVAYAAARGRLSATFANMRGLALPLYAGVAPAPIHNGTTMPYALAIFAGALLTSLTGGSLPHLRLPW